MASTIRRAVALTVVLVAVSQVVVAAPTGGRNGTRPLADRRSGDGTAPAGVFPLGTVRAWDGQEFQFFGNRPDPGVRGSYRDVRHEDCWGATATRTETTGRRGPPVGACRSISVHCGPRCC